MNASAMNSRPAIKSAAPSQVRVSPAVDVVEGPNKYRIFADMPGTTEAQIDITLDHLALTVRAAINEFGPADMPMVRAEFPGGEYVRRFEVGNDIDREAISAAYRNGVLEIVLPKVPKDQAKKIVVRVADERPVSEPLPPAENAAKEFGSDEPSSSEPNESPAEKP